jgi:hypothetical protein
MRRFLLCLHDATPAYARETREIIRDLAPLVGRRFACAVVPDWHRAWPLVAHRDYCRLVQDSSGELLLHGYLHHRPRGWGPVTWFAERSDEMTGLDVAETRHTIERGQRAFADVFGAPARGFLAPAWQRGHVCSDTAAPLSLDYVLGYFSLQSVTGRAIPLATWTWDCGRWGWLGQLGHGLGWLSQSLGNRIPSLAIHPRDVERGYWPRILRLTRTLLDAGYQPHTPAAVLGERDVEVAA